MSEAFIDSTDFEQKLNRTADQSLEVFRSLQGLAAQCSDSADTGSSQDKSLKNGIASADIMY